MSNDKYFIGKLPSKKNESVATNNTFLVIPSLINFRNLIKNVINIILSKTG